MSGHYVDSNQDFIAILPGWAQEFAKKYGSKTANLYILHGNIRDYLPHEKEADQFSFTRIQEYVSEVLFGNQDIIAFYDLSKGVAFCTDRMSKDYQDAMRKRFPDRDPADFISAEPEDAFFYLEKYFVSRIPRNSVQRCRMVLIIDYAETVVPSGDLIRLNDTDRYCLVTCKRWA
jgi:hypothetical protein